MKPIYLFIDTTSPEKVHVQCGRLYKTAIISREQQSSRVLLPLIQTVLKKSGMALQTLNGIGVISGPGPFTSLRVGVATANTLGFALGIPVVGVRSDRAKSFRSFVTDATKQLSKKKKFVPVTPYYGRPPHITKRKKRR